MSHQQEKQNKKRKHEDTSSNKQSKRTTKKTSAAIQLPDSDDQMDIDSGDESDGKNALRKVEVREELKAGWQGPGNASMQHFHEPTAIVDRSRNKHWEFRCRFCPWYVNFLVLAMQLVLESPVQSGLLPIFGKTETKTGL